MEDLMLRIDNVSKRYKLGQIGGTTLRDELQRWGAKRRGKEDPTKKIGAKDHAPGETFLALNGVSFDVRRGERVGIIGHNGAGKSTLLKLISRVTAPTSGAIGLNGRVASMLEVGTGFHPELTGRENIYMNGAILGMTRREINAKMDEIIEFSECRGFIDTPVKRYSSGMYVKLAFSVAANLDSEIMIMDEVLAVGDTMFQNKCIKKMSSVSIDQNRTIVFVSHNMSTIRRLCERVIVLNHGRVAFDGDTEEGIDSYINCDEDMRVSYDYTQYKRSPNERRTLKMESLNILGRDTNRVRIGDTLSFVLHCKANDNVSNLRFRLEVYYTDDTIVGTMFSDKTISASSGSYLDVFFSCPTSNFTPGRFRFVALLFEAGVQGGQYVVDRVDPAMTIEMVEGSCDALAWSHQYWGHIQFPNLILGEIITR